MAISDYCINVEHLLYGTLLSFQLKIYNERKKCRGWSGKVSTLSGLQQLECPLRPSFSFT